MAELSTKTCSHKGPATTIATGKFGSTEKKEMPRKGMGARPVGRPMGSMSGERSGKGGR